MKFGWLIAIIFCCQVVMAQVAPGDDFKAGYIKEMKNFETALKGDKNMEAEKSFQSVIQMQQRHKKFLETKLKTIKDSDESAEIAQRIDDEENIIGRLKELSADMQANRQEILEEMNGFLDE